MAGRIVLVVLALTAFLTLVVGILGGAVQYNESKGAPVLSIRELDRAGAAQIVYLGHVYQRTSTSIDKAQLIQQRKWPLHFVGMIRPFGGPAIAFRASSGGVLNLVYLVSAKRYVEYVRTA